VSSKTPATEAAFSKARRTTFVGSMTHQAASLPRTDRRIHEHESDAYALKEKLPDPTAGTACGALYRDGRWCWGAAPADAHCTLCPACKRIESDDPAGIVVIEGEFVAAHRDEIQGLIRHVEEREKQEHPLKRIMRVAEADDGGLEVTTTDARLARGIGEALHHAYQGSLDYHFTEVENLLRIAWKR